MMDLHIHSKYSSDGEFKVSEIIEKCINNKVNIFSITDHNSVKANNIAFSLLQNSCLDGLNYISGIEIDCNFEGIDLHMLGYNIDSCSDDFSKLEKDVFSKMLYSFEEMVYNLHKLGFKIEKQAVLNKCMGSLPTAELIAEVMIEDSKFHVPALMPYIEGGERSDMPYVNFYLDFFAQGKPAYVPVNFMDFKDAIQIIKDNGGTPVVAHPGLNLKNKETVVEKLLIRGAEGLEVFNNYHSMEQILYFASVVEDNKLIMTCGSDFHGKNKPLISIGQYKFINNYENYLDKSIQRLIN